MAERKASSKINTADAQEWLETLQQVGEGWWRQVALAVRAGAPDALEMDRREFTAQIGQRLIDPREAIIELYRQNYPKKHIADVLRVSGKMVNLTLYEAGLIPTLPRGSGGGDDPPRDDKVVDGEAESDGDGDDDGDDVVAQLEADIVALEAEVKAEKGRTDEALKEQKKEHKEKTDELVQRLKDAEKARRVAEEGSPEEQERLKKEIEAREEAIYARLVPMHVTSIIADLQTAKADLSEAIEHGLEARQFEKINRATTAFLDELEVAAAAVDREVTR